MVHTLMILRSLFLAMFVLGISGCATYTDVTVFPAAQSKQYRSAYLVAHAGKSHDVDAKIESELTRRGLDVVAGAEGAQPVNAGFVLKYKDSWGWNFVMYLKRLEIWMYDGESNALLASGTWDNRNMGFHGVDKAVPELIDELFRKVNMSSSSAEAQAADGVKPTCSRGLRATAGTGWTASDGNWCGRRTDRSAAL